MSHSVGPKGKKDLNYEINLVPFLDLLSVCIYFLLLTAIWVQVGAMNVKQAMGPQTDPQAEKPSMTVQIQKDGSIETVLKNVSGKVPAQIRHSVVKAQAGGQIDYDGLTQHLASVRTNLPDMSVAVISSHAKVVYEDLIQVMDRLRGNGFLDVGVTPL